MIFSDKNLKHLCAMRIDPDSFSDSLLTKHGKCASHFDSLMDQFSDNGTEEMKVNIFCEFAKTRNISDDSSVFNELYDLFNYLRLYREGGVFKLFKGRQAEWGGPKITITESDVPPWDSSKLKEPMAIYRGMSKVEYDSGDFGQSWTVQEKVAYRFATETYSDIELGIVVKINARLESVLHFDSQDIEGEVILKDGSVSKNDILEVRNGSPSSG